jgi:diguanylate cyclase
MTKPACVVLGMASQPQAPTPPLVWLLGQDADMRGWLEHWLIGAAIYAGLLVAHVVSDALGLFNPALSIHFRVAIPVALLLFYAAMRSGWSRRFADPALTTPQMMFAILLTADANLHIREVRGMILVLLPMILLFGAFTLRPSLCVRLGWFAVAALGVETWLAAGRGLTHGNLIADAMGFGICSMVLMATAAMAGRLSRLRYQLEMQKAELQGALDDNRQLAREDALTGLPNRRHAEELLVYEERRSLRHAVNTCVCLVDLDHFKSVNDLRGHSVGDEVLRVFAREATAILRDADVLARWGGEEFLVLMPDTGVADGEQVLVRLHAHLARPEHWAFAPGLAVTFSAGIAALEPGESAQAALGRADDALYRAKTQGRNRTVVATPTVVAPLAA